MKSNLVVKRTIILAGRKTSISQEDAFWDAMKVIARSRAMTLSDLVAAIDADRHHTNLSSAIRLLYSATIVIGRPMIRHARKPTI
jgi:predicted DNA-binding ribbon-helix-helix protein